MQINVSWRGRVLATLGVLSVVLIASFALTPSPVSAADCAIPALPTWSPAEVRVWNALCAGNIAQLNTEVQSSAQSMTWSREHQIRAAFIEGLLAEPYVSLLAPRGLRLSGVWISDALQLFDTRIDLPIRCSHCRIQYIDANDLRLDADLNLIGSLIESTFLLDGATIGGDLVLDSVTINGDLATDSLNVAGDFDIAETAIEGTLRGGALRVGGDLRFRDVEVDQIALQSATIGGSVLFQRSTTDRLDFSDSTIGGMLQIYAGESTDPMAVIATEVSLLRAVLDGLIIQQARVGGVDVSYASINGPLVLYEVWDEGSFLRLASASAQSISVTAGHLPAYIELGGFIVEQWRDPGPDMVGASWFLDEWFGPSRNGIEQTPAAYFELARVLEEDGFIDIAADLSYAGSDRLRASLRLSDPTRWRYEFHRLAVGYGHRPTRPLYFAAVITIVGVVMLRPWEQANGGSLTWPRAAMYSVGRLVPGAGILAMEEMPALHLWQEMWFSIQAAVGWLVMIWIVAWLTGLV